MHILAPDRGLARHGSGQMDQAAVGAASDAGYANSFTLDAGAVIATAEA
jgi:hypothetical protein